MELHFGRGITRACYKRGGHSVFPEQPNLTLMDPSQIQPQDLSTIPAMLALVAGPSLGSTFGAIMLSTFFSLM